MLLSRRTMLMSGLATGVGGLLAGCTQNAATGRSSLNLLSADDEASLGADEHPKIIKAFGGVVDDPEIGLYVARVGAAITKGTETPAAQFTFTVLDTPIVNAMALPGGYVYVTRGLMGLANSEAELAGVLAHEVGHIMARHTNERVSQGQIANLGLMVLGAVTGSDAIAQVASLGAQAYLKSYSRDQEYEADSLGVRYLGRAGYDPNAMASFLQTLLEHSRMEAELAGRSPDELDQFDIFATHPRTLDRVQAAIAQAQTSQMPVQGRWEHDAYLQRIAGLVHGDNPKEGVVRGSQFLHPVLGFQFSVPQGFRLVNSDRNVSAQHPAGASIVLDGDRAHTDNMAAYMTQRWARRSRVDNLESIQVNGLPAATGTLRLQTRRGPADVRLVAMLMGDSVYRFMFITPPNLTARFAEDLKRTTYSFRALSPAEKAAIKPHRIRLVTVGPRDSIEGLARRMEVEDNHEQRFRVLNGLQPGQPLPPPGSKVKVIGV